MSRMFPAVLLCLALMTSYVSPLPYDLDSEELLRTTLMATYNPKVRPSNYTEVNMSLVLISLNDLNIGDQSMSTTSILYVEWVDERLQWDSDLTGVQGLLFDITEVWVPPIIVDNAVKEMNLVGYNKIPFRVFPEGRIYWTPPVIFETSCEMKVLYFPFEQQTCSINLLLYGYSLAEVGFYKRLQDKSMVITDFYSPNAVWNYENGYESETYIYDHLGQYKTLKVHLQFRRRWLFLALTLMLPTIMNLLLMLGVFFLNIDSGEKMGYSLTVLLSYIVLLTLVGDTLPQISTDISLLQGYLAVVLVVGCMSTLITVWIINVHNRDDEKDPIPNSTKRTLKWLVFPVVYLKFWKVQWQNFKIWKNRHNKVSDDESDSWNDGDSTGRSWESDTGSQANLTSVPPKAVYESNPGKYNLDSSTKEPQSSTQSRKRSRTENREFNASLALRAKSSKAETTASTFDLDMMSHTDYGSLYKGSSSHPPPQPMTPATITSSDDKDELDNMLEKIQWKDVAVLMDSFFLRVLGSLLLAFTVLLILILFLQY